MGRKQMSFFNGDQDSTKVSSDLAIVAQPDKKLSKEQQKFNKLAKQIERLQESIKSESAKLERLLKVYIAEIPERKRALAHRRLSVAKALDKSTQEIKYGNKQLERLRTAILCLCDEAFADIAPDKDAERFYNEWADTSYGDEVKLQMDEMKADIAAMASAFGFELDPDEIDETPEGIERLMRKLQGQMEQEAIRQEERASRRKKSKKQQQREEARKQEEERAQRSIRSIYLSLAKALHPDTITDLDEKARREELMKKVTEAYAAKDLPALLKLELEWVRAENKALDNLPDEELKLYIASLKEQVNALEQERQMLYMHPRYDGVASLAVYAESYAISMIRNEARDFDKVARNLEDALNLLSLPSPKKEVMAFVASYIKELKSNDPFDGFDL